jgi:hypothetical protein
MAIETESRGLQGDPRTRLVKEKYFALRPKPLERWLWQQGVPQAAERVFWLHWEQGMRSRDWCSQLPIRQVAAQCCVDPSTVTRAYQVLRSLGLIRREDPGRDPLNPFQQATAVTEVLLPRELLALLPHAPNRLQINQLPIKKASSEASGATSAKVLTVAPTTPRPSRQQVLATWERTSASERSRYFNASRTGIASIEFDLDTRLTQQDRSELLTQLRQMAHARNTPAQDSKCVQGTPERAPCVPRRLSLLALARARQQVFQRAAPAVADEILRQVIWAIEEGALRRFEIPLALNIALKKIRQNSWTRPHRMPPNWSRLSAAAETCNAA